MRRFTSLAESVLDKAKGLSLSYACNFTGSEHVLLAMLMTGGCIACKLLTARGITSESVTALMPAMTLHSSRVGDASFSVRMSHILDRAAEQAYRHGSDEVGTEHILLSMVSEDECVAARLITEHNVKLSEIFSDVTAVIGAKSIQKGRHKAKETGFLKQYGVDLCERYVKNGFPVCVGREAECESVIRILSRKTKNNPCLLGEAGVGKTTVAEGVAALIHDGRVPEALYGRTVVSVDMAAVLAGAKYRGDFEERFRGIISEASERRDVILFIDELHTVMGAGAAEGAIDASNMLKQPLGRGDITVIGATTYSEYEKYIESDAALARRFQPVTVPEPDDGLAYTMLCGVRPSLEYHHNVRITDGAVKAAVDLSRIYIKNRYLPDKAIDLLDETAAELSVDPKIKDKTVNEDDIRRVIYKKTGYDDAAYIKSLTELEDKLNRAVVGQKNAIHRICKTLIRSAAGFSDGKKPRASFLFGGPTGVGKTETCRVLSELLTGKPLIRFDMSEYMERHTVSRLIGSPPGYIGYGEGGLLTECVRRNPRAVICFDEAEKAHRDIYGLFLQILEEGELTDSRGRRVDFSGTVIIFTSNDAQNGMKAVPGFRSGLETAKHTGFFSPELCGRINCVINFSPLDRTALSAIIKKRLDMIKDKKGLHLTYDDGVCGILSEKCDVSYGGRDALRVVSEYVEDPLSELLLSGGGAYVKISSYGKDIVFTNAKGIDKPLLLEYN